MASGTQRSITRATASSHDPFAAATPDLGSRSGSGEEGVRSSPAVWAGEKEAECYTPAAPLSDGRASTTLRAGSTGPVPTSTSTASTAVAVAQEVHPSRAVGGREAILAERPQRVGLAAGALQAKCVAVARDHPTDTRRSRHHRPIGACIGFERRRVEDDRGRGRRRTAEGVLGDPAREPNRVDGGVVRQHDDQQVGIRHPQQSQTKPWIPPPCSCVGCPATEPMALPRP